MTENYYFLLQLNCKVNNKEFKQIKAINFKFENRFDNIEEEIFSYINGYEKGWKNQALQKLKPENFNGMKSEEVNEFLGKFQSNCNFLYEEITNSEYESWKEIGKAGSIMFV